MIQQENKTFFRVSLALLFSVSLALMPVLAFAATAVVEIDTGTEDINALEGILVFPESVNVREIQTGNSVILIWLEKPYQRGNIVTFAGITPGGFMGTYPIFAINGEFDAEDLKRVQFESISALKNDGSGMSVPVRITLSPVELKGDTELPEEFTPTIATDPNIFDGKYFLVFATQDKSSGIDRYEAREGRWGWFKEVESPYLLKHQRLDKDVYIKAIDNAGNERIVVVPSRVHSAWWEGYGLLAILMVIAVVTLAIKRHG